MLRCLAGTGVPRLRLQLGRLRRTPRRSPRLRRRQAPQQKGATQDASTTQQPCTVPFATQLAAKMFAELSRCRTVLPSDSLPLVLFHTSYIADSPRLFGAADGPQADLQRALVSGRISGRAHGKQQQQRRRPTAQPPRHAVQPQPVAAPPCTSSEAHACTHVRHIMAGRLEAHKMNPALPLLWRPVATAALLHDAMHDRYSQQRPATHCCTVPQSRSVCWATVLAHC